jgi:hypothetical protein
LLQEYFAGEHKMMRTVYNLSVAPDGLLVGFCERGQDDGEGEMVFQVIKVCLLNIASYIYLSSAAKADPTIGTLLGKDWIRL